MRVEATTRMWRKWRQIASFFGAEGITVHPRPDERHIRYSDVRALKKIVKRSST